MRSRRSLPPRQRADDIFVLFVGDLDHPRGGVHDLAGVFRTEGAAREAFRQVRLDSRAPGSWAQVARLDTSNRVKPVCWFGSGSWKHRPASRALETGGSDAQQATGRRLRRLVRADAPGTASR